MTDQVKYVTVAADIDAMTPEVKAWLRVLQDLVANAPSEAQASIRTQQAQIGIAEVTQFFKDKQDKRAARTARAAFYWLVRHLDHILVVLCTDCGLRRGQQDGCCRCARRGLAGKGGIWWYKPFTSHTAAEQHYWRIVIASLGRVTAEDLHGDGLTTSDRSRAIELLEYLRRL